MTVRYFSKWNEIQQIKSKYSVGVAKFLYEDIIYWYGCVAIHIIGQGKEFVNIVSTELQKLTGTKPI